MFIIYHFIFMLFFGYIILAHGKKKSWRSNKKTVTFRSTTWQSFLFTFLQLNKHSFNKRTQTHTPKRCVFLCVSLSVFVCALIDTVLRAVPLAAAVTSAASASAVAATVPATTTTAAVVGVRMMTKKLLKCFKWPYGHSG